jgi:DNA (cytosine-5)-methyltransferase 1
MRKPLALDLFCGAGGATKGLQLAGFHVTGVDIKPQPRYCGDAFIQADALKIRLDGYDFIWASPPCQAHSRMSSCRVGLRETYPELIPKIRWRLDATRVPFCIENVEGAPLVNPIMLCGSMFRLQTYRHRLFEIHRFEIDPPLHLEHRVPTSKAGHWKPGTFVSVAGHCAPIQKCREAMGIDWMNREELAEAIPPDYSQLIGECVADALAMRPGSP